MTRHVLAAVEGFMRDPVVDAQVLAILTRAAVTGSDPLVALNRKSLLRTRDSVVSCRRDTLNALADLVDDLSPSQYTHSASQSAGGMKQFLTDFIRDLARRQAHEGDTGGKGTG